MNHWRIEVIDERAIATLDVAGASANILSHQVLQELDQFLTEVEQMPLTGLMIRSGKPSGFIAGADVREFEGLSDADRAVALVRFGQRVFDRLEGLPFPTVALIHGYCLGGGLELALACDYRIAREDEGTRLGLPEVRLGIHPGFGGTVRLPRLIGPSAALDLILTGRSVNARGARKLGLVDQTVPERYLLEAGHAVLTRPPIKKRAAWAKRLLGWQPIRSVVSQILARKLRKKFNPDHYPAPYRVLQLWKDGATQEEEAISVGELLLSPTSRNLVRIFLLGEELKRRGRKHRHKIERVHVIGAGVMGGDIAAWIATKGFSVSLQDQTDEILARAVKRAHQFFTKKLKSSRAIQEAMDRLMPDISGHGLKGADLVIEAIIENVDAKQKLFREVEQVVRPEALLATNTSSIPLEVLAQSLRDPSRLVGLHFFNPVAKMQLVEVVRGRETAEAALDRARAFTLAIERLPLDVKSAPGFLVNRILIPYLMEAMEMVAEGVSIADIDRAATDFGMPMGPILLADTVGLDVCLSVAEELSGPLGFAVPNGLRAMVQRGELGKKSGKGFYRYEAKGRPKLPSRGRATDSSLAERLILRMLNEAMACLREGVVADADAVDAGMVYGTGFAPYLGGPMRYAKSTGNTAITQSLRRLAEKYGNRFIPGEGWSRWA